MLHLIGVKCIQEPSAPEVHLLRCINGSVFSEAFLVGVDALVTIVMDITALRWALFEILLHQLSCCRFIKAVAF